MGSPNRRRVADSSTLNVNSDFACSTAALRVRRPPTRAWSSPDGPKQFCVRRAISKPGYPAFQAERIGRLRVAASFTIAEYLLPQWLGRFSREHPGDSIALSVANSTSVIERIRNGEADLGFVETPTETPDLHERTVAHDELVAVVAPQHPWAAQGSVPVEALAATPLVMREAGSGTREALASALADLDMGPPLSVLELGSTSAVRAAVKHGNSPTVISRVAVADELENGVLVGVAVAGLTIKRRLRAIWRRTAPLSELAAQLLESVPAESAPD